MGRPWDLQTDGTLSAATEAGMIWFCSSFMMNSFRSDSERSQREVKPELKLINRKYGVRLSWLLTVEAVQPHKTKCLIMMKTVMMTMMRTIIVLPTDVSFLCMPVFYPSAFAFQSFFFLRAAQKQTCTHMHKCTHTRTHWCKLNYC